MSSTPADAVATYREALARTRAELVEFGIDGLDRTGVPVWTVAAFLPGGVLRNGVGYGEDHVRAEASALGECLEVLCGSRHLPEAEERPQGTAAEGFVDPVDLVLPAGSAWEAGGTRRWVTATRLPAGDEVRVPLEWVAHTPGDLPAGYAPLVTPITNGLGAHTSREAAIEHAVRELVQRDGNAVAYRALDRGVVLDVDLTPPAPGIRPVAKAAISDLGLANVYVVADDDDPPHPLCVTACGEAADPDPARAVGKALRELCASRARKPFNHGPLGPVLALAPADYEAEVRGLDVDGEEPRALEATLAWLEETAAQLRETVAVTFSERERIGLDALPSNLGRTAYDLLVERGFDVLVVDLSPPGQDDLHVVKVLVPGLEVETMSYGRCGARNLDRLLGRDLGIVGTGPPPAGCLPLRLPASADRGPAWLSPARVDEVVGDLYPLYREPSRHVAALVRERRAAGGGTG